MAQQDIICPIPGTFYRKADPTTPPFVEVGSVVQANTVIGVVEVMKQFSEISASIAGRITEILVADGEPVDVDQVLMRIEG
ncbi:acetyl-CoA carboxylase [Glaciimonas soli]|uniref:Biotin carboxyl carrier protein of acetyl-CoA carboxylase n=1 Tax=Glaciimonas soli TaxID=2590999 RepID=A0A843YZL7_9BURK|nr:acetyl-CoA carboxylase [Glaciimonas soli]MQR02751.1 biotin carboxyl carrier domain-containing protein [Glaciimonas soli]